MIAPFDVKLTEPGPDGKDLIHVVEPETGLLLVHRLEGGKYGPPDSFLGPVAVPVGILPGVAISLDREESVPSP